MAKKKDEAPQIDLNAMPLDEALEALNEKWGEGTFILASKAKGAEIRYSPTGIYALDFAIGGGVPQNRVTEIHGNWSTFKSTTALLCIANHQRMYLKGLGIYIDLEHSFDPVYAAALGVDLQRLILVDPNTGENSVDQLRDVLELDLPIFVVIDSVAAMRPSSELTANMDQAFMGHHARLVGRAMGILNSRLKRSTVQVSLKPVTVLILNQLRSNIGMYVAPESTPGGRAKDFFYSVAVRFAASGKNEVSESRTVNGVKRKVRISQTVEFKVKKNKTSGPQNEEDEFTFYEKPCGYFNQYEVDNVSPLLKYGLYYDIISHDPKLGYSYKFVSTGKKISAKKESDFLKQLHAADQEETEELYFAILDKINPPKQIGNAIKKVKFGS